MMDEGDVEDVGSVSQVEEIRSRGKEIDFSPDIRKVVKLQGRVALREGDYPRSSIQQFVAMFDGHDPSCAINVEASQNPCTSFAEGRIQELTFGHFAGISTMNEGDPMESMMNELQPKNQPDLEAGAGSSREYSSNNQVRGSTPSSSMQDLRFAGDLVGEPSNYNTNGGFQSSLPSGGTRMKVISKSSGGPEYFVKNTLMGKGVLRRGPISTGADFLSQDTLRAGNLTTSDSPVNLRGKYLMPSSTHAASRFDLDVNQEYTPTTVSDTPVSVGEKSSVPYHTLGDAGSDPNAIREAVNDGVCLRDWIRSGQSKLHKVDSLCIFKQVLDLVHSFHSEGKVLVDLRPSSFRLFPARKVKYRGRLSSQIEMHRSITHKDIQKSHSLKRALEQGMSPYFSLGAKHQKLTDNVKFSGMKPQFELGYGLKDIDVNLAAPGTYGYEMKNYSNAASKIQSNSSRFHIPTPSQHRAFSVVDQLEEKWYRSPEEVFGRGCASSSNIYCLGIFLFELLSSFDSTKEHAAAMSDLRHRILPPSFLSENSKEAGFCLWLLHPEPSLRPATRDILQSQVVSGFEALCGDDQSSSIQQDEGESELLLHFLVSNEEQKQKHASKLVEDLGCLEADIRKLTNMHLLKKPASENWLDGDLLYARERSFVCNGDRLSDHVSVIKDSRFLKNVTQLENAYFSVRSEIHGSTDDSVIRADTDILKNQSNLFTDQKDEENQEGSDNRGAFFEGLCKYARYSKLEVCGTLRSKDSTNSTNVICSLSFDRDEDYFAAAGVSKKIKIFNFQSLYDNSVDIHYPEIEMSNKSKLSCVSWNKYIRNYLASTDYDGIVKLWDASTGQAFSQYTEHGKRAWSVDFSPMDPTKLASGSDDCSVKLWNVNEKNSLRTIRNIANVCCVQFSSHSSNMLAFGSSDYKIYCYDLRNANVPWCILAGHEKAVSYVKFVDSETIVSASTDNTLKVWDLNRSKPDGISHNACSLTLSGHTNEKNFVGLSAADGYIACGSETNEVYTYYKSLPMPVTAHKFGSIDPISGNETDDDARQFVSSVCWKGNSNLIVAANSTGCIKVLRMV